MYLFILRTQSSIYMHCTFVSDYVNNKADWASYRSPPSVVTPVCVCRVCRVCKSGCLSLFIAPYFNTKKSELFKTREFALKQLFFNQLNRIKQWNTCCCEYIYKHVRQPDYIYIDMKEKKYKYKHSNMIKFIHQHKQPPKPKPFNRSALAWNYRLSLRLRLRLRLYSTKFMWFRISLL